jgi:hypothetical protein
MKQAYFAFLVALRRNLYVPPDRSSAASKVGKEALNRKGR